MGPHGVEAAGLDHRLSGVVNVANISPDGSTIASAARDGTARTWDTETGAPIAVHEKKGGHYVDAVSFSPDGRWVLSVGNGWAEIWNARSGKVQTSINIGPEDAGAFDTFAASRSSYRIRTARRRR
jgi:WD40 repeat protein